MSLQETIERYNNDHLNNWDTLSEPSQNKYLKQNIEWSEPEEQLSAVEGDESEGEMSTGRKTPTQSTCQGFTPLSPDIGWSNVMAKVWGNLEKRETILKVSAFVEDTS